MVKIQIWDHHNPICVHVIPELFRILSPILSLCANETILQHWGFKCVISLADLGQNLASFPKPGSKRTFIQIQFSEVDYCLIITGQDIGTKYIKNRG